MERGRDRLAVWRWQTVVRVVALTLLGTLLGLGGCSNSSDSVLTQQPVACADIRSLRDLGPKLAVIENPRTGNSLEYVVIGDGADSDEVIVLFPGTGGVLADWPTQMITNASSSPEIVQTQAYDPLENAEVSLCHRYRLLLLDYAGVGAGHAAIEQTLDSIASDVDALLNDATRRYRIPTDDVNLLGWSLGTVAAMKFSFLSTAAAPGRRIHDLILIATRPGGGTNAPDAGNQAQCVTELFDALEQPSVGSDFARTLETDAFKLTFPYVEQTPYDGADSGCVATVDSSTETVDLNVNPDPCLPGSQCARMYADQLANRESPPWAATEGVPYDVYVNEREFDQDWNVCYCAAAGADFTSQDCSCSAPVVISSSNGGVCQCQVQPEAPQAPSCASCVDLRNQGRITVLNGYEDLFVQWTYGRELVRAYRAQYGDDKARIVTYPGEGGAGHGLMLQHPRWTQERVYEALNG